MFPADEDLNEFANSSFLLDFSATRRSERGLQRQDFTSGAVKLQLLRSVAPI
jgi:hypothetical protein